MGRPDRIGRLTKVAAAHRDLDRKTGRSKLALFGKIRNAKRKQESGDRRPESGAERLKACPTMRRFVFEKT